MTVSQVVREGSQEIAVRRVLVATDRSETANEAVRWAARLAATYQAELVVLQVIAADAEAASLESSLATFAREVAGERGRAKVVVDDDPAAAILDAVDSEDVDVVVVGNVGMRGRRQFLLGNIPNRVSHNARCSVVIVNTSTAGAEPLRLRAMGEPLPPGQREVIRRALQIGWTLLRAAVGAFRERRGLDGEEATRAAARRLRAALDELGPTFAKLGQLLSTRPDLLPPAVIEELSTLQDRVTPLAEPEVVAVMERELGVPWEDVFASIDPRPLAAGTIAQVHRATLESGERVVVKVQRPTAERDILQDLALLETFASRLARRRQFSRVVDLPAMIEHLSSSLRRELSFLNEAANLKRMRDVLSPFPRLGVPDVYEQYSTPRLLVMQEVLGGPVRDAPEGPARKEAARQLLEAFYHQVMVAGFFHADPHPGNLKWWNDRIYFLDLGMVGEVDAKVRQLVVMLMLAFARKDADFLAEVVLALSGGQPLPAGDDEAFRDDLRGVIDRYGHLSLSEIHLGALLQEVTKIAVSHQVKIPASLTLMAKAFAQWQLVAAELDPTLDPFAVAQAFLLRSAAQQLGRSLDPQQAFYEVQKARLRLDRLLEGIEGALGTRPGTGLQVQAAGIDRIEAALDRTSRRLSLVLALFGTLAAAGLAGEVSGDSALASDDARGIGASLAAGLIVERPGGDRSGSALGSVLDRLRRR